ncbi:Uncharacterised protein [Escherichia coli]|nr:Uncharacterised protein [Escherichia coli]VVZ63183.1 Uncharacterised protein [Escherichia coli]VWN03004.1 Uncharacterised protein [Escherichia coli]
MKWDICPSSAMNRKFSSIASAGKDPTVAFQDTENAAVRNKLVDSSQHKLAPGCSVGPNTDMRKH